jgi:hypothetical protein
MVLLLVLGAGLMVASGLLFRAAVLFPLAGLLHGWTRALGAYKFSIALSALLALYEAGNITGFSWERLRYVRDSEFIRNAIRYAYPGRYESLADLRADHPGYQPQLRLRGTWNPFPGDDPISRYLGFICYEVTLPDTKVALDADGTAQSRRGCEIDPS